MSFIGLSEGCYNVIFPASLICRNIIFLVSLSCQNIIFDASASRIFLCSLFSFGSRLSFFVWSGRSLRFAGFGLQVALVDENEGRVRSVKSASSE